MSDLIAMFINFQFMLLCLGIAAITFVARTTIEYFVLKNPKLPGDVNSRFWRELFLPIFPVLLGVVFPFVGTSFMYPVTVVAESSKIMFGLVAGLFSPTLYRVIKGLLNKQVGDPPPLVIDTTGFPSSSAPIVSADDTKMAPPDPKV